MYAVTDIPGQAGGATARPLLAQHQPIRAVLRDPPQSAAVNSARRIGGQSCVGRSSSFRNGLR